ncbi:MAG: tetratricopeptide repeat protein, partial [Phormidesmis sp.]
RIVSGSGDNTLRLWRVGTWKDELRYCCNLLMHHTALAFPQTETAQHACEVCQQVWTRQQSAEFLVAQGNALARRGEVDQAIAKYTRAKDLDPDLTLDPTARAQQLADWSQSPTAKPKT